MVMRAATASWASGPAAETVTCWPLVAPRPITPSTLLASAVWLPAVTDTAEANRPAATASAPAGVMTCSQLADMTCLLGRGDDRLDVAARGGRDRRGDRALDERRVGEQHALGVAMILEHRPDGEYRAAQVRQHDHAGAAFGVAEPAFHLGRAGPEIAVVGAPGRDDGHRAAADLRGQVRRARGEFGAMRDEDDSDGGSGHGIS